MSAPGAVRLFRALRLLRPAVAREQLANVCLDPGLALSPVLLIEARTQGTAFAADAAAGTLLGLAALSGFAIAYARSARRTGWRTSLAAGWAVAAGIGAVIVALGPAPLAGPPVAAISLFLAYRALPGAAPSCPPPSHGAGISRRAWL